MLHPLGSPPSTLNSWQQAGHYIGTGLDVLGLPIMGEAAAIVTESLVGTGSLFSGMSKLVSNFSGLFRTGNTLSTLGADTDMTVVGDSVLDATSDGSVLQNWTSAQSIAQGSDLSVQLPTNGIGFWSGVGGEDTLESGYVNFEIHPRVLDQLNDPRLTSLAGKLNEGNLIDLANSTEGQAFYDAKSGYINYIQTVDDVLFRITIPSDEFKIISVGPIRPRNIINSVSSGRFTPIGKDFNETVLNKFKYNRNQL